MSGIRTSPPGRALLASRAMALGPTTRPQRPDVAFFLPHLGGGGVERVVLNLINGLSARGHVVELVLMQATGALLADLPSHVHVVDLRLRGPHEVVFGFALPGLARYLRAHRPRILYSGMTSINAVAIVARALANVDTRVVVSEHVPPSVNVRTHVLKRPLPLVIRSAYPHADAIVAVAGALADDLANVGRLPRDTIDVVYNPAVDDALLSQAVRDPGHPWLVADVPVLLGVGRLTPQKDFGTLIEAFALVRRDRAARLVILGEGPDRAALEAQARRLGVSEDVSMPGFSAVPAAFMARASVFVSSSAYEGLAMALMEALACGCPCVSTDCLTGPQEILDGGRYGPLVPVGDAAALALAIMQTMDAPLPRDVLRTRGMAFSVDRSVAAYEALFERLASTGRRAAHVEPRLARRS